MCRVSPHCRGVARKIRLRRGGASPHFKMTKVSADVFPTLHQTSVELMYPGEQAVTTWEIQDRSAELTFSGISLANLEANLVK